MNKRCNRNDTTTLTKRCGGGFKAGTLTARLAGLRSSRSQLLNQMYRHLDEGNTGRVESYRERFLEVQKKIDLLSAEAPQDEGK